MLKRLQASTDGGDNHIINMNVEGDGVQNLKWFKRIEEEKVLRELMADMCVAGCQHFAFLLQQFSTFSISSTKG
jgi:hypothetical protein